MGGGDLNMQKSWHPLTPANRRRVAEEKQRALDEAQRAAKLQKELREERQQEELDRLNAAVTKKSINKLEWMYNAPSAGAPQSAEDLEAFLLGKRDATELAAAGPTAEAARKPDDKWKDGLFAFSNRNANCDRDAMAKAAEDPLAEIQRREQAAARAMAHHGAATTSSHARDKDKDREHREKRHHKHKHRHRHRSDRESDPSRRRSRSRDRHHHSGSGSRRRRRSRSPSKP